MLLMLQVSLYPGVQEVGGANFRKEVCLLHLKVLRKIGANKCCNEKVACMLLITFPLQLDLNIPMKTTVC